MKRKWIEIALNMAFWAGSAWLIFATFSIEAHEVEIINGEERVWISRSAGLVYQLLLTVILSMALFYLNRGLLARLNDSGRRLKTVAQSVSLFFIVLIVALLLIELRVVAHGPVLSAPVLAGIVFFYYAVSSTYGIGKSWLRGQQQLQMLALQKREAELSLLRMQLQPHFLFNVLNNLLSMVDPLQNPALADSIDRLSALLRYVVYETRDGEVPVAGEIDFIRNYAALQQLRFEENEIDFKLQVTGEHDQQQVEAGLFVPFVENAFKHGARPEKKSFIRIHFDLSSGDAIVFSVENSRHDAFPAESGGEGISATRKRLALIYPKRHRLEIEANDTFTVKLEIMTHERDHR